MLNMKGEAVPPTKRAVTDSLTPQIYATMYSARSSCR
jgi:hypothetical protein